MAFFETVQSGGTNPWELVTTGNSSSGHMMYLDYNGTYHFMRQGQGTASGIYIDVTVYNSSNWTVTVKKACKAYHVDNNLSGTATVAYTNYNVGDSFRIGSGYNLNYFTEP